MALDTWLIYLAAMIGLSLTPGPNTLLALTHGALYGRRKTLFTVAGGALGFTLVIALSLFGIGALLQASATLFTALKIIGGAYLVWLGIQLWRAPAPTAGQNDPGGHRSGYSLFRQGLLSALTNPKAVLFFAAFLPQFIDPERELVIQFMVMAATFALTEFVTELLIASFAQRTRAWLARSGRRFNRTCAGLFMLLGGWLPLAR
ncbi:LysE family translocator [Zobellella maritima]|uniref:LysE family translocator n=1 Tax=Zobellella maritima TaxID=2059725 RepID=UPI000E2FFF12|nr:LysE family translocator [Zobellella maritima]